MQTLASPVFVDKEYYSKQVAVDSIERSSAELVVNALEVNELVFESRLDFVAVDEEVDFECSARTDFGRKAVVIAVWNDGCVEFVVVYLGIVGNSCNDFVVCDSFLPDVMESGLVSVEPIVGISLEENWTEVRR